jgi:hypothetical protein
MASKLSMPVFLLIGAAAILAGGVLAGAVLDGEPTGPEMLDFKANLENHPPPNESQVKFLLEGARAQPHSGQIWITDAKLTSYRTNGALEIEAETPRCIFDSAQKTVSSREFVQVHTADHRYLLEGEGFLLQQTNSQLTISNRVHTVIRNATARPPKS